MRYYIYRCWYKTHRYDAHISPCDGGWDLTIVRMTVPNETVVFQGTTRTALGAKIAMYLYFPYGTVKWNRIR